VRNWLLAALTRQDRYDPWRAGVARQSHPQKGAAMAGFAGGVYVGTKIIKRSSQSAASCVSLSSPS
jgi:hypothetical protein